MRLIAQRSRPQFPWRVLVGAALVACGEALIIARHRPVSDFYFPFVWLGFILILDGAVEHQSGCSLYSGARRQFLVLFPISAAFWWLFELLNQFVHNWIYLYSGPWRGFSFVAFATVDFATVLPAVWTAALFVRTLLPVPIAPEFAERRVPLPTLVGMFALGLVCLVLPVVWPGYAFGLIWLCMFLILDPVNERLGRPSIVGAVWRGDWRMPASFALGALMCGLFWEGWNYWAKPKWTYSIPHVGFWHIFEMPFLGWGGYLPFGLELFAMANFILPFLGVAPLAGRMAAMRERASATLRTVS